MKMLERFKEHRAQECPEQHPGKAEDIVRAELELALIYLSQSSLPTECQWHQGVALDAIQNVIDDFNTACELGFRPDLSQAPSFAPTGKKYES